MHGCCDDIICVCVCVFCVLFLLFVVLVLLFSLLCVRAGAGMPTQKNSRVHAFAFARNLGANGGSPTHALEKI